MQCQQQHDTGEAGAGAQHGTRAPRAPRAPRAQADKGPGTADLTAWGAPCPDRARRALSYWSRPKGALFPWQGRSVTPKHFLGVQGPRLPEGKATPSHLGWNVRGHPCEPLGEGTERELGEGREESRRGGVTATAGQKGAPAGLCGYRAGGTRPLRGCREAANTRPPASPGRSPGAPTAQQGAEDPSRPASPPGHFRQRRPDTLERLLHHGGVLHQEEGAKEPANPQGLKDGRKGPPFPPRPEAEGRRAPGPAHAPAPAPPAPARPSFHLGLHTLLLTPLPRGHPCHQSTQGLSGALRQP